MILVTGGTGLVGAHLLLQLVKENTIVRAIYRANSNLQNVKKAFNYYEKNGDELFKKIDWVIADINDIPALESAFKDVEYVYHAAAMISFDPNDFNQLVKINAEGTANMVNLCVSNAVKKFCYVSTIGTIGKSQNGDFANEESDFNQANVNVYAQSKYMAEMEVWRAAQEGLAVVMVNPGVILGPGFWHTGTGALFKTAYKGYKFYPPGGTGFVTVHDVIKVMTILMKSTIKNERYIMVTENLSFQDILSQICPLLGKAKPIKKLAYWQLEIGRIVDVILNYFTKSGRRITRASIHSMKYRDKYSNKKVKNDLQFEFETLNPTIAFCCARFLEENQ